MHYLFSKSVTANLFSSKKKSLAAIPRTPQKKSSCWNMSLSITVSSRSYTTLLENYYWRQRTNAASLSSSARRSVQLSYLLLTYMSGKHALSSSQITLSMSNSLNPTSFHRGFHLQPMSWSGNSVTHSTLLSLFALCWSVWVSTRTSFMARRPKR